MTDDVDALISAFAARFAASGLAYGHGTDNPQDEARRLVTGALRGRPLTAESRVLLDQLLERRITERVPVAYLTGEGWFGGMRLSIPAGVVIPRSPIAEVLAARARPWLGNEPRRVLDLCCGSGCIGLAAAHVFARAKVDLVDDDPLALRTARENVGDQEPELAERIEVIRSDLFGNLNDRRYDLVLCNPPYVPSAEIDAAPAEFRHEPRHGLDGGPDGLQAWRRIVAGIGAHLAEGGVLIGEAGNLSREFDAEFPELDAIWLDLERAEPQAGGGFGVFAATPAVA